MSFLKKKKSAREISKEISEGKEEPQHLGKYSAEMVTQEIYSLQNSKPMFRDFKWKKRFETVRQAVMKKLSRNENSIMCQYWLKNLELIENER